MSSAKDTPSSADAIFATSEPQLQEFADDPQTSRAARPSRKPPAKTNMIAREVVLTATGVLSGKTLGQLELLSEETSSLLVHENGGVIQLSADVSRGQLLLLTNVESKRKVVAQITRTYKPMNRCVELEFAEPAPRFWGVEFSAATALLPKSAKDQEAAALLSGQASPSESSDPLPPPTAAQIEELKREINALKGDTVPSEPIPGDHDAAPFQLTPTEKDLLPRPALDFSTLPKSKGLFQARGKLTPGAGLRLAALTSALALTIVAAVWFTNRTPKSRPKNTSSAVPAVGAFVTTSPSAPREMPKQHPGNTSVVTTSPAPSPILATPAGSSAPSAPPEPTPPAHVTNGTPSPTLSAKAPIHPPARVPEPPALSRPDAAVVPPKLLRSVMAVASLDDLHDFETGNVVIDAVVDTEGAVHFISVISGPPSLRRAAVEAVKQYQYEPATRNGQPVPEHVHITIRFRFES